ncbi:MAG: single-stranded DNA-binding protein, partial [Syntrophotalea sp.]|uniref:single-stranded DNA-binding protein n=1 Tax=Syntrophotalea sp. TaxID=2812029 RepID=UPI003D1382A9
IEGKIQTRSYEDRDGNKRYITEIVADQMQMLGRAGDDNSGGGGGGGYQRREPRQERSGGGSNNQPRQTEYEEPPFNPDDDIPF